MLSVQVHRGRDDLAFVAAVDGAADAEQRLLRLQVHGTQGRGKQVLLHHQPDLLPESLDHMVSDLTRLILFRINNLTLSLIVHVNAAVTTFPCCYHYLNKENSHADQKE